MHWTTTPPTVDGFYWAEEPSGQQTIVHYHAGYGRFLEVGSEQEALRPTFWVRFSSSPIPLPAEGKASVSSHAGTPTGA